MYPDTMRQILERIEQLTEAQLEKVPVSNLPGIAKKALRTLKYSATAIPVFGNAKYTNATPEAGVPYDMAMINLRTNKTTTTKTLNTNKGSSIPMSPPTAIITVSPKNKKTGYIIIHPNIFDDFIRGKLPEFEFKPLKK